MYLAEINGKEGIRARLVAHSKAPNGVVLSTLELKYPRFFHSELMTHRVFSRNAASSRAIPSKVIVDQVLNDPAMPIHWGQNQPGMQARAEEIDPSWARDWWAETSLNAVEAAKEAADKGLHKQIANRVMEPWMFMTTLVTSTEWANFFDQRISHAAQPEFRELAECMLDALSAVKPTETVIHLPYVSEEEKASYPTNTLVKLATTRCCRVSYQRQGESTSFEEDIYRHDSLKNSGHWSPFEHVAYAAVHDKLWGGNLRGWVQYRQVVQGDTAYVKVPVNLSEALVGGV